MVNSKVISLFSEEPLPVDGGDRTIAKGPLYSAKDVLAILATSGSSKVQLLTRRCREDVQDLGWDTEDVITLVRQALLKGRYLGSQWCQTGKGPWAACDSYVVSQKEWIEHIAKEMPMEYYIKFAIGKTGNLLLIVSCHLSRG